MLTRMLAAALIAGLASGIVLSVVQQAWVTPLIHEAEAYESAGDAGDGHGQNGHATESWMPGDGVERTLYTLLANVLNGVGFALLLGGGIALSGRAIDWRQGLIWGLAGFVTFAVAPALGLPPDPPGVDAGALLPRQIWWLGTAAATGSGLWLLLLTKRRGLWALGVLALAAPHLIGAPVVDIHGGPTPPELITEFIAASLISTGLFWLALGGAVGFVTPRLASRPRIRTGVSGVFLKPHIDHYSMAAIWMRRGGVSATMPRGGSIFRPASTRIPIRCRRCRPKPGKACRNRTPKQR